MTLIKDLIDIPDNVGKGDFVLKLSEGVTNPEATVRHYQVTPELAKCFDEALNLIKTSLQGAGGKGTSKASYLHGSFGSGKSHFMAILHLILSGNVHARSIPELADVMAKHSDWTEGKKFLLVPYHLLGAENLESRVLGGYSDHIRRLHPDAPTPALYGAKEILDNAEVLRLRMGDTSFLAGLNEAQPQGSGGWGNLSQSWSLERYQEALNAPHDNELSKSLTRDLMATLLPAMTNTNTFVNLDAGFAEISQHAEKLGYDAVVLFLDELILWLASHAADHSFVSKEGNKVVKLVESGNANRPIPLVSFIARQRDLRDLIGKQVAGAEKLAFSSVLDHHEGRFGVINLEDRNLPAIAEKRILLAKNDACKLAMDAEFERTRQIREETMRALLTRKSNRDDFRKLYPFSPALVETLVAVSSLLQRERTALKVMAMLLSVQKETLALGEIVPVGDLFDQVSEGDEAFSSDMKTHFENAKTLYRQSLKPILETEHQLSFEEAAKLDYNDPKRKALRNDDRLIKTLLLAALVPEVESLKDMTPSRLAALNHGSIKSPIAGQESSMVLGKLKRWAAVAGQIKITEGASRPTISIQLSSIDTEQILAKAEASDNRGNRISKLRELIFEALGNSGGDELKFQQSFKWRGTSREADIIFGNIRELPFATLQNKHEKWKVVIDYPFDDSGHSVRDDVAKLEKFASDEEPSRTLCWLPSFFNMDTLISLGNFVRLESILKESQFPNYVEHLNAIDRETARNQLKSQRDQLRSQLVSRIEIAYGIRDEGGTNFLDASNKLDNHEKFTSLDPDVDIRPPASPNLREGLLSMLDQALGQQYPGHPKFSDHISLTKGSLNKILEVTQTAVQSTEPSIVVESSIRKNLSLIGNELQLGKMGEQRFEIGRFWKIHFTKKHAEKHGDLSVGRLREWINEPKACGLPTDLEDLIILIYAEQSNLSLKHHGGPVEATIGGLEDDMILHQVALPSENDWKLTSNKAKELFGISTSPLLNATNVTKLSEELRSQAKLKTTPVADLQRSLITAYKHADITGSTNRLNSLNEASRFLSEVKSFEDSKLIEAIASFDFQQQGLALGKAIKSAYDLRITLDGVQWNILDGMKSLADQNNATAQRILDDLKTALESDEHAIALQPKLSDLQNRAFEAALSAQKQITPPSDPIVTPDPPIPVVKPKGSTRNLLKLYPNGQVKGEQLPSWISEQNKEGILRLHQVGSDPDAMSSYVVLTPLYEALVRQDPDAKFDLEKGILTLPKFNQELSLNINPQHDNPA